MSWHAVYGQAGVIYGESLRYDGTGGVDENSMQTITRPYAQAATITGIALTLRGSADFYAGDPAFEAGDCLISADGAEFTSPASSPTTGADGLVELELTAAELTCARLIIRFSDQTVPKAWEDHIVAVETTQATGELDAHVTSIGDVDTSSFTNLKPFKDGPTGPVVGG